jgi:hypothetical protein
MGHQAAFAFKGHAILGILDQKDAVNSDLWRIILTMNWSFTSSKNDSGKNTSASPL